MKDLLAWWFFPKPKRVSSIIKIIIGLLIFSCFFGALIGNTIDFIHAFVNPPLYIGKSYLLLPIISTLFTNAIFWGGLFYFPYYIFGKRSEGRKRYLISLLLVALIISIVFAGRLPTKPGSYKIALTQLAHCEARLGEMEAGGRFYTLREFGYDIARFTKPISDNIINEEHYFSDLVIFYKRSEMSWEEYDRLPLDMESTIALVAEDLYGSDGYERAMVLWFQYEELPSTPASVRTKYRSNHPEVDASLLFWGKSTSPASGMKASDREMAAEMLSRWFDYYGIDMKMHPHFANWSLLTEEEWLDWAKRYLK